MADDNHVTEAEWTQWEADRLAANRAYDEERRAAAERERPQLIESLRERVEDLEVRVFWAEELLAAAVEREAGRNLRAVA